MDIREEIARKRENRIKTEGYGLSTIIPKQRQFPITPFNIDPIVICEVKRGSPSKGGFAMDLNGVEQAEHYYNSGIRCVSVLTEEDYFFGSLQDLIDIKSRFPELALLRKDFLTSLEDIRVSYLCGADAFLLIASLLSADLLGEMYKLGIELGMTPLVEVHDEDDVNKIRDLKPVLTGINSRNLRDFSNDKFRPHLIRQLIDWDTKVIYESGIKNKQDGEFVFDSNFNGILVGEWAVKDKLLAKDLLSVFKGNRRSNPWNILYSKKNYGSMYKPLVKICGITNKEDYNLCKDSGADLLGFILADSPRKVSPKFIRELGADSEILRVGVVVLGKKEELPGDIADLVRDGYLDFIQFHGDEDPDDCNKYNIPYYKAHRVSREFDFNALGIYGPRDLVDSFSISSYGGTGKLLDADFTNKVSSKVPLWLAGGLNPDNIRDIVKRYKPELIDLSSGLELEPGKKDKEKVKKFFMELK